MSTGVRSLVSLAERVAEVRRCIDQMDRAIRTHEAELAVISRRRNQYIDLLADLMAGDISPNDPVVFGR